MNGQLSDHPVAELIPEILEKRLSGSLRLQNEQSQIVLYLENGRIVYAASNVRSLRLVEYVKKRDLLKEDELKKYNGKSSDLAFATAMAASGAVPREDIYELLMSVVTDVVRLALLWSKGTWHFDQRARLAEPIQLTLNPEPLLLECARRIAVDVAQSRFSDPDEVISVGNNTVLDGLDPTEGFLLSRVDSPIKLSDLVAVSGLSEARAIQTIYGLTLAGLLQRENRTEALARTTVAVAKPSAPASPVLPQKTEEEELNDFLGRMEAAENYYEVLGVGSETAAHDVKQAYYGMARKYHPDRFRGRAEPSVHARLESAFARITQAYETLIDSNRRRGYDLRLAAEQKAKNFASEAPKASMPAGQQKQHTADAPAEAEAKEAEDIFKEGFAALQQGQSNIALGLLAAAVRSVPQEARYRAYYGKALSAHAKTRRAAEAELQAAVKIDPNNASYRVMLAELYSDLGFPKRALAEAERALTLDPGNSSAREIVQRLK